MKTSFLVTGADLVLRAGKAVRLTPEQAFVQRCKQWMRLHLGSYRYNVRAGVQRSLLDLCDDDPLLAIEEVRRSLMRIPGVAAVQFIIVRHIRGYAEAERFDVVDEWEASGRRLGVVRWTVLARDSDTPVSSGVNLS
jgi:hypothetical protein